MERDGERERAGCNADGRGLDVGGKGESDAGRITPAWTLDNEQPSMTTTTTTMTPTTTYKILRYFLRVPFHPLAVLQYTRAYVEK